MRTLSAVIAAFTLTLLPQASADELAARVDALVGEVAPRVVQWRRDFHAHPELSNREERTSRAVAEALRAIGIEQVKTGVARHGVVALIPGGRPGKTVALRADMDALPIQEQTGLPFSSQQPGVMHACGHDGHTAMLLGAAQVLWQLREELPGSVKLIFQPAEEGAPAGEEGGARVMVREGVLREPEVAAVFGLHVAPDLPTGTIGYRLGGLMAGVDRFRITIEGKQSHAAQPWQGIDPIVTAAQVITALQTIASRKIDAREPVVVSVGVVRGGTAWNIIPGEMEMEGTVRTHSPQVREQVKREFLRLVAQTAAAHGAKAEIEFDDYGPAVWNDPELGRRMLPALERMAGTDRLIEVPPQMVGEDFAYYAREVPGLFVFLGVGDPAAGPAPALHTPQFVLDEAALPLGVKTHVTLALEYLREAQPKP